MNRRRTGLATALAMLVLAAPAEAALRFEKCGLRGPECAKLRVPLDRSGAVAGTIDIAVRSFARGRSRRPPLVLLAGGPGQSAIGAYRIRHGFLGVRGRRIVAFDQRGTGRSGALRCRDLEHASLANAERQAAACATLLGRRRHLYRTTETVEDIEALRRALGADRIALLGVSYGTYVAQAYAARYPANVERLVLDSVVDTTGVDAFYRDTIAAARRVLPAQCRRACRRFTRDPVGDLRALVERLAPGSMQGFVVDQQGRRRKASLGRAGVFATLVSTDVNNVTRLEFPGAVVSARRGDPAPLLRALRRAEAWEDFPSPHAFSHAVLAAAMCGDTTMPWPRTAPVGERGALAWRAAELIPAEALFPFDVATVSGSDVNRLCRRWPAPPTEPPPIGPLPDVPALVLAGSRDLRTPVETARRVAARFPRARMRVVDAGHSTLGSSGCATSETRNFLNARRPPRRCGGGLEELLDFSDALPVREPAPLSLRALKPPPGTSGRAGRVVAAVDATLLDLAYELLATLFSPDPRSLDVERRELAIPGLRGGRFLARIRRRLALELHSFEYVPGVRVSGRIGGGRRERGVLRLHGPGTPDGRLRIDGARVRGRIGKTRVSARLPELTDAAGAARVRPAPCPRIMGGWRGRSSLSLLPARLCLPRRLPPAPR